MVERLLPGIKNRLLQMVARSVPGATTLRVRLHRWRGVKIGRGVWIGYDAVIETSSASRHYPRPRGNWYQGHYYGA